MPFFTRALLDWYHPDDRPLPWKHISDPYLIWLSEIILQQTRAAQGLPYYERFREAYPSVQDLAAAPESEVLKLWEGLGYYSRARNLHAAAKMVAGEYGGQFPRTYREILGLKGVGPYTAAAIASFAFGLPHAVLDGNVYRVLSRYTDDSTPIDTTAGKKHFMALADKLLDRENPARYNQAIMDLGATICTPKQPDCVACPVREGCQAFASGTQLERPQKSRKLKRTTRYFNYLVVDTAAGSLLHARREQDVWKGLFQFPLVESTLPVDHWQDLLLAPNWPEWLREQGLQLTRKAGPYRQELTHQRIVATFWEVSWDHREAWQLPAGMQFAKRKNWSNFAFPKVIHLYLADNSLTLF